MRKILFNLNLDQAGPPGGMEAFELAGRLEDRRVAGRSGVAACVIARNKSCLALGPESSPDLPDRGVGQLEFLSDRGQFLSPLVSPNDLLAELQREGTRHEPSSQEGAKKHGARSQRKILVMRIR
jgi:hypothetical protein